MKSTEPYSLPEIFRFGNWWHYKIPPLIAVLFFTEKLSDDTFVPGIFLELFLLLGWMLASASFGYFINDWSDIEEDRKAGKENKVVEVVPWHRWVFAVVLIGLALTFQSSLNDPDSPAFVLTIIQLVFFILYSAPPFRLKLTLPGSILCDSMYAHLLPVAIVFTSACKFQDYRVPFVILCVWQFIYGMRNILLHHLSDRKHDARSGNNNLANRFRPGNIVVFINQVLFPLDIFFAFCFFYMVSIYLVIMAAALILLRLFLAKVAWRNTRLWSHKKMSYWLLNDVYEGYLPFISILLFALSTAKIFLVLCAVYPFIFPQFVSGLTNDCRHLTYYLKAKFTR